MLFWIIALALSALVTLALIAPLRQPPEAAAEDPDTLFYRGQLAEIERDAARGLMAPAEAERARAEIARRLIAADRSAHAETTSTAPRLASWIAAGFAALTAIGGALGLYWTLGAPGLGDLPLDSRINDAQALFDSRPNQASAEAMADALPAPDVPADYLKMVEELREVVPSRPDDLTGWQLLSRHEAALGNYSDAAKAQRRVIELKGPAAGPGDRLALADRMIAAAGGIVSPEAEAELRAVRDADPENVGAQYYFGLLYAQTDRPDLAFQLWRRVVERGDPMLPHTRLARGQIERAAAMAGVDYQLLPETASARGPSADDIAAAQDMAPGDREAMIRGMVEGLAERLGSSGGTPEDWARLIGALGVLGDTDRAAAIWTEAQQVFAGQPGLDAIRAAAAQAGVTE